MHKKLLVLVLASVFASPVLAQSNVTVSGMVSVSYKNYKIGHRSLANTLLNPTATENRLDDNASRFIFKGKEDLGGGLSALFQIDTRVNLDMRPHATNGDTYALADGETFVSIQSKNFGQLGFGKYELHFKETQASEKYRAMSQQENATKNIMGTVGGGGFSAIAFLGRSQNVMKYETPNWSDFSASLAYSFNPAGNEGILVPTNIPVAQSDKYNDGGAWNLAARYRSGPINVYTSYWDYRIEGRGKNAAGVGVAADQKSFKLGGDYSLAMGLTLGLHYDRSSVKHIVTPVGTIGAANMVNTNATRTAWMLPLRYNTGAHGVYLTYARAGKTSGVANSGAKNWIAGYDFALSKRTSVGAFYNHLKNDSNALYMMANTRNNTMGGSTLRVGESSRQFSLSMRHRF